MTFLASHGKPESLSCTSRVTGECEEKIQKIKDLRVRSEQQKLVIYAQGKTKKKTTKIKAYDGGSEQKLQEFTKL